MAGAEPFAYYGTDRSASTVWQHRLTADSLYQLMTLDALSAADLLERTPLLVVHGRTDEYCPPSGAQAAYDRTPGPREILWLDTTNHIDLYDRPRYVEPAVSALARFFARELGEPPGTDQRSRARAPAGGADA